MKTLEGHTLLYDASCPMCRCYTSAFIRTGKLDGAGRAAYHQADAWRSRIDEQRAANEIALINRDTGAVYYGVDSLLAILGHSIPALESLFRRQPMRRLAVVAYSFISYNRRVIVPATGLAQYSCRPSQSVPYRMAWLVSCWLITALVLTRYSALMTGLIPPSNHWRELAICGGQLFWQSVFIARRAKAHRWNYLGHLMTISLGGALLLLPAFLIHALFPALPALLFAGYFLVIAGLMLLEHLRRCRIMGAGWLPSVTWVAYRILVLIILLVQ